MAKKKDTTNGTPDKNKKNAPLKDETPVNEPGRDGDEGDQNQPRGEEEKAGPGTEKKLSETDVLKLYLEQSLSELKKTKGQLEESQSQLERQKDETQQVQQKLASMAAEYENYRRRTAAEKEGIYTEAVSKAVTSLLPALDSLEKAEEFAQSNPESLKQGVEMTLRQLRDGFAALGVTEIQAEGAVFDPDLHNAVMHVEDENLGESVIANVFQKGYQVDGKVIRHSVVQVAN